MIKQLNSKEYNFYFLMGKFFADRGIIRLMDCQLYSNDNMQWYVYFDKEGNIRGFASVEPINGYLQIDNFYVVDGFRGKGIGSMIIDEIMQKTKGRYKLITRNDVAYKMFSKRGFVEVGNKGRYKKMECVKE